MSQGQGLTRESQAESMKRWEHDMHALDIKATNRLERARRRSFVVLMGSLPLFAGSFYLCYHYRKVMDKPGYWTPLLTTMGVSLSGLACVFWAIRISKRGEKYYGHHVAMGKLARRNFWEGYGAAKVELDYSLMQDL